MSVLSGSIAKSTNSKRSQVTHRVMKYKFTNLTLSYQVRQRVYELLISFDDNVNYQFQREEIEKALVQILKESQQELGYVTRNVFRYDANHDGIVTYQQFTNFCVEQHFGEMAIQRLHRQDLYKRGRQRIMSRQEFKKTLEYCLSFIQIDPSSGQLDQIFSDVDKDMDNYITYSEYFTLLREYFGSQSEAAQEITIKKVEDQFIKKPDINQLQPPEKRKTSFDVSNSKFAEKEVKNIRIQVPNPKFSIDFVQKDIKRIAKLIIHQFRINTMDRDYQKMLNINKKGASQILINQLSFTLIDSKHIIDREFGNHQSLTYEKFVEKALQIYMCQMVPNNKIIFPLKKDRFISEFISSIHFIKAKPFETSLGQIFDKLGQQSIEKHQYIEIMNVMFGEKQYGWVRKTGQYRQPIQSPKRQQLSRSQFTHLY